jgi:hypothetical protein
MPGNQVLLAPHKRTEGRAPVWGSEFTSKDAAVQGGSEKSLLAERKIMRPAWLTGGGILPPMLNK